MYYFSYYKRLVDTSCDTLRHLYGREKARSEAAGTTSCPTIYLTECVDSM
jgi:hypothetical protein